MVRVERTDMVFCDCGSEGIGIDYDEEDDTTSLAFWQLGQESYKLTWSDRVRWIIQIIKGGRPYTDMVILDKIERTVLIRALQEHTPETEQYTYTTVTEENR